MSNGSAVGEEVGANVGQNKVGAKYTEAEWQQMVSCMRGYECQ